MSRIITPIIGSFKTAAKAWVATVGAVVVPVVAEATESLVLTLIAAAVAGLGTYEVPNKAVD